jgi:hypothetical protein
MIELKLKQGLFPFSAGQLDYFEFGRFALRNVFGSITENQRQQCVELWLDNNVLPNQRAALERSNEVCYMLSDLESQRIIGVNTLYPGTLGNQGAPVWLNRMFIDPHHRSTRLMITGTAMMLCYAKTTLSNQGHVGVVNVNENRKLSRPGMQRIFERLGYRRIGWQAGNEVLLFRFSDIQLVE